ALLGIGRTYHRSPSPPAPLPAGAGRGETLAREPSPRLRGEGGRRPGEGIRERHRIAAVMFGAIGSQWGDTKRAVDFFDIKGIVEQIATKLHVDLSFAKTEDSWLLSGKRAEARHGEHAIARLGFVSRERLQKLGVQGVVV